MHALARLIQQRRREDPDLTFARIAELSGGAITSSLAQRLGSRGTLSRLPEARTIKALAKALEVPESSVLIAAAQAVGIDVRDIVTKSSLSDLQADLAVLPEDLRREITNLIRAAVRHLG